ncbi:MAG: hypothetical protein HRU75_12485 [Planctomycetia bacterium]|nr:MAG: hypothetical protein HRU75_12485 [Planctomycetia bacterium]
MIGAVYESSDAPRLGGESSPRRPHSTPRPIHPTLRRLPRVATRPGLRALILVALLAVVAAPADAAPPGGAPAPSARAESPPPSGSPPATRSPITATQPASSSAASAAAERLRSDVLILLRDRQPAEAVARTQRALREHPGDAAIVHEFVALHLALARDALASGAWESAAAYARAVLAVRPDDAAARSVIATAAEAEVQLRDAPRRVSEWLRLELFEPALELLDRCERFAGPLDPVLTEAREQAWLGAADDHYLAGNFAEGFSLYERRLSLAAASQDVHERWGLCLALALAAERDPISAESIERLRSRAAASPADPRTRAVIEGLLLEAAGQGVRAGESYAAAVGESFGLPSAEERSAALRRARSAAMEHVGRMYRQTATRRRTGEWSVALPGMSRTRQSALLDVTAANDALAERIFGAAGHHLPRLAKWLGMPADPPPSRRLLVHVHADSAALVAATGASEGSTDAVRVLRRDGRVTQREIHVVQSDPWLLNSTLPACLVAAVMDGAEPATNEALVGAIAETAQCPARRLALRRAAGAPGSWMDALRSENRADLHGLAEFLLDCAARVDPGQPAAAALLAGTHGREPSDWPAALGFANAAAMESAWREWRAGPRPARMPLILHRDGGAR